jgi:hypothetical protein
MHYKNGRKAMIGDQVIGVVYNTPGIICGRLVDINTSQDPKACNCKVAFLPDKDIAITRFVEARVDYSQCNNLLHAEDAYHFVLGMCYSGGEPDYMAKIMNFDKWNAPVEELSPADRPVRVVRG